MYREVKFIFFSSLQLLILARMTRAAVSDQAPNSKEWSESLTESGLKGISAPMVVSLVERFGGDDKVGGIPKFKDFDFQKCQVVSYLKCVSHLNSNFAVLLNDTGAIRGLSGVHRLTNADSIAFSVADDFFLSSADGRSSVQVSNPPTESKTYVQDLMEALITSLGYDGVILAVRGDFALIGSTENRLQRLDLQGLALSNSHDKWALGSQQRRGAILLSLVNFHGPYGVFRFVMTGASQSDTLHLGGKVILESK